MNFESLTWDIVPFIAVGRTTVPCVGWVPGSSSQSSNPALDKTDTVILQLNHRFTYLLRAPIGDRRSAISRWVCLVQTVVGVHEEFCMSLGRSRLFEHTIIT